MGKEQRKTVLTAPERIWLQVGDQERYHSEPFPRDSGEVTWCSDSASGCEVPYVRADLALTIPDGWKLVPVEPEFAMLAADGCKEHHDGQECNFHKNRRRIWSAMLSAAPEYKP